MVMNHDHGKILMHTALAMILLVGLLGIPLDYSLISCLRVIS